MNVAPATSYLISALCGASIKAYDDIHDNQYLPETSPIVEILKVSIVFFTTLFLLLEFRLSLIMALVAIASLTLKQVDSAYWKSLLFIPFVTTALTYPSPIPIVARDYFHFLCLFLVPFFEAKLFPEEASKRKLIARASVVLCLPFVSYYLRQFESSLAVNQGLWWAFGYFLTSVGFQAYSLSFLKKETQEKESIVKDDVKPKDSPSS
jgi:hypothetical protein